MVHRRDVGSGGAPVRGAAARRASAVRELQVLRPTLRGLVPLAALIGCHLVTPYSTNGVTEPLDARASDAGPVADTRTDVGSGGAGHCEAWSDFSAPPVPIAVVNDGRWLGSELGRGRSA